MRYINSRFTYLLTYLLYRKIVYENIAYFSDKGCIHTLHTFYIYAAAISTAYHACDF